MNAVTLRISVTLIALATAAPALAGVPVPGEEAGIGLLSMALVGAGYLYLRRRLDRR